MHGGLHDGVLTGSAVMTVRMTAVSAVRRARPMIAKRSRDEIGSMTVTAARTISTRNETWLPFEHPDLLVEMHADAARADDADDGGRAGIGFEIVEDLARR